MSKVAAPSSASEEKPGDLQPVKGWGNERQSFHHPLIHKSCPTSHFTPQHLPTVPERYTYSSQKCLWREIISKRKHILWQDIAFGAVSISVEMLTLGMVSGLNVVWLRDLGGTCLYKNPTAGRFCHLSA